MAEPIPATLIADPDGDGYDSAAALTVVDADGETVTLEVSGAVGRIVLILTNQDAHDLANRLRVAVDATILD